MFREESRYYFILHNLYSSGVAFLLKGNHDVAESEYLL